MGYKRHFTEESRKWLELTELLTDYINANATFYYARHLGPANTEIASVTHAELQLDTAFISIKNSSTHFMIPRSLFQSWELDERYDKFIIYCKGFTTELTMNKR